MQDRLENTIGLGPRFADRSGAKANGPEENAGQPTFRDMLAATADLRKEEPSEVVGRRDMTDTTGENDSLPEGDSPMDSTDGSPAPDLADTELGQTGYGDSLGTSDENQPLSIAAEREIDPAKHLQERTPAPASTAAAEITAALPGGTQPAPQGLQTISQEFPALPSSASGAVDMTQRDSLTTDVHQASSSTSESVPISNRLRAGPDALQRQVPLSRSIASELQTGLTPSNERPSAHLPLRDDSMRSDAESLPFATSLPATTAAVHPDSSTASVIERAATPNEQARPYRVQDGADRPVGARGSPFVPSAPATQSVSPTNAETTAPKAPHAGWQETPALETMPHSNGTDFADLDHSIQARAAANPADQIAARNVPNRIAPSQVINSWTMAHSGQTSVAGVAAGGVNAYRDGLGFVGAASADIGMAPIDTGIGAPESSISPSEHEDTAATGTQFLTRGEGRLLDGNALRIAHALRTAGPQIAGLVKTTSEGALDVRLNPEELGLLRISFHHTESGLQVAVHAERAETQDLVRRHLDLLAKDLESMGFGNVDVGIGAGGSGDPAKDRSSDKPNLTSSGDGAASEIDVKDIIESGLSVTAALDLRL